MGNDPTWHKAACLSELPFDKAVIVEARGLPVALYRLEGGVHATAGHCPHEGECLESGYVDAGTIECSLHYAIFDIATGALLSGPSTGSLEVYPVKIEDEAVYVALQSEG